jgi:hypothetical protein
MNSLRFGQDVRSDVRDEEVYKAVKEQGGKVLEDLFDDFRADFKKKLKTDTATAEGLLKKAGFGFTPETSLDEMSAAVSALADEASTAAWASVGAVYAKFVHKELRRAAEDAAEEEARLLKKHKEKFADLLKKHRDAVLPLPCRRPPAPTLARTLRRHGAQLIARQL